MHTFIFLVLMKNVGGGGIWNITPMPNTDVCVQMRIPLYSITDWHRSPISDSHPFDQPGT